jgi:DNA-binding XRE family transcriptional regulator
MVGSAADPRKFGALVRQSRTAAGLTLEDLAERTGLGVRTISDIERGLVRRPHRSSVELICAALGLGGQCGGSRRADGRAAELDASAQQQTVVPRQLPAAVTHFTGRAAELAALTGLLEQAGASRRERW